MPRETGGLYKYAVVTRIFGGGTTGWRGDLNSRFLSDTALHRSTHESLLGTFNKPLSLCEDIFTTHLTK